MEDTRTIILEEGDALTFTKQQLIDFFMTGEITSSDFMLGITHFGFAPSLVFDDNGHWAISDEGYQNVPMGDEPEDISLTIFIEAKAWKPTIREAIEYYIEND